MAQELTPQEQEELRALLRRAFQESEVQTLLTAFERMAARRTDAIARQDVSGLQNLVVQLGEGQRALQDAIARLADAQARTEAQVVEARARAEERFGRLEEALTQLTQSHRELAAAQARTEERVGRLEEALTQLTQSHRELVAAQARTEERVGRLEEEMALLTQSHRQLAEAQAETARVLQQLARQVGGLSETVGGDIEDIAYIVLHDVLKRELGWEVGLLERVWQNWDGEPVEVNVFGQAQDLSQPDRTIWIVGEAKHNLTLREAERFAGQVAQARRHLQGEVFPVCFCYRARPEVRARLQELGIRLVFSYGRMM
jgi:predicted  nucleic acid-binding Zn-ribbon protein